MIIKGFYQKRTYVRTFYNMCTPVPPALLDKQRMLETVKTCIPPLDGSAYKGQAGRIGIVGGSLEYTGAPYFAGITALKIGADLAHIFCSSPAATVIKSYSPELIVHPLLDQPDAINLITPWLDRLHAIVIGPGLGREKNTFKVVSQLIEIIKSKRIPLVIDADGLFLIKEQPDLLNDFNSPVVLTPNQAEFMRFSDNVASPEALSKYGCNLLLYKKGKVDEVFSINSGVHWQSSSGGSGRRCGGQGDLLAGSIAIFLHWTLSSTHKITTMGTKDCTASAMATSVACFAASCLIRKCNEMAFKSKGRSMLATDMIEFLHVAFEELFEC